MKTLLKATFALLALAFVNAASAQKFSIGLRGGGQYANVKAPDAFKDLEFLPDFQPVRTGNVGLVAEVQLHPNFALQPELGWAAKGTMIDEQFDVNLFEVPVPLGVKAITKFNYLEMPLLAKAKFGHFYLLAGPSFGYALNGHVQTRADLLLAEVDLLNTAIDLDEIGYQRWEVGGVAGAGVTLPVFGAGQFFLDARFSHAFTQSYDIPVVHDKVMNRSIGLNAGFLVPIVGKKAVPRA